MKSKLAYSGLAAAALLALTQPAAAQGTSGGTGAVASIPGSVVRGTRARSLQHCHWFDLAERQPGFETKDPPSR